MEAPKKPYEKFCRDRQSQEEGEGESGGGHSKKEMMERSLTSQYPLKKRSPSLLPEGVMATQAESAKWPRTVRKRGRKRVGTVERGDWAETGLH